MRHDKKDMVTESLKSYIEDSILPLYDDIEAGAGYLRDRVLMVIDQSLAFARQLGASEDWDTFDNHRSRDSTYS